MKFCDECMNMCVLSEDKEQLKLYYYCNECNIKKECRENILYDKKYMKKKEVKEELNKEYIEKDNTYPRINIDCPKCNNIENMYYKNSNMNVYYVCSKCKYTWS